MWQWKWRSVVSDPMRICTVAMVAVMAGQLDSLPIAPLSTSESIVGLLRNVPGVHGYVRRVIRDNQTWRAFWDSATVRSLNAPGQARLAAPKVDFGREMLIVASDGMRRNYDEINVVGVIRRPDNLVVQVRTRTNLAKGCVLESLWAPMAIVRVPKDPRSVSFVEQTVDEQCGAHAQ